MSKLTPESQKMIEPFTDRLLSLFCELDLACRWDRPAILFAVYNSDYTRAEAQSALEKQLKAINLKIFRFHGQSAPATPLVDRLASLNSSAGQIMFIDGIECVNGACNRTLYTRLNTNRDIFVENNLRVVFWLNEKEVYDLANAAPDLWSYRHRVVDFPDVPEPEKILARTLEAAWENLDDVSSQYQLYGASIGMPEALLTELPHGEKNSGIYLNLLLTLGILHWRKQDFTKADEFIRAATEIAEVIQDSKLLAECLNAGALVKIGQKNYEDAVVAYHRSLSVAPNQAFPWSNLGNLYNKLSRDHEAISAFKKALAHDPADAFSWNGMASIYARLQLPAAAIEHYQKALELTPNFAPALVGLGSVHAQAGDLENARSALLKALKIDPKNSEAWLELARLYARLENTPESLSACQKALELDPRNIHALRLSGENYLKAGMNEEAILAIRSAISLQPDWGEDYSNLGLAHFQNGSHTEAIILYRKSLELPAPAPVKVQTYNRLGDAYRQQGDYQKAMESYQSADQVAGRPISVHASMVRVREEHHEIAELVAAPDPQPVLTPEPDAPDLLSFEKAALNLENEKWLSNGLDAPDEMDDFPVAVVKQDTETFVPQPEDDADFSNPHFWTEAQPNLTQSVPVVEVKVAAGAEDNAEEVAYWNSLGNQYLQQEAYNEAIAAYTRAIELSPSTNWSCIKNLAVANYRKGKMRGAQSAGSAPHEEEDGRPETEVAPSHCSYDLEPDLIGEVILPGQTSSAMTSKQLNQFGLEHIQNGDYTNAAEAFIKAIDLDQSFGWAYCNLGLAYFHLGKHTYALLSIKRGLEFMQGNKDKAIAWRRLNEIYSAVGDTYNATHAMEMALSLEREKSSLLQRARSVLLGSVTI